MTKRQKLIPQPMVAEIDSWEIEIKETKYKLTIHQTTPHRETEDGRIFFTYSFHHHEYSRSQRVLYERLSREEVEQLFESIIKEL